MKKILITFCFFSFQQLLQAHEGIVIVLQAPLVKEPHSEGRVLQYVRKGEHIYIPADFFKKGSSLPAYIPTFDRAGNSVFIKREYIKPITNDERENLTNINYGLHDPTDYRLEEPIPSTYPFSNSTYLKASFSLSVGNNNKSPYDYQKTIQSQDYANEKGGRFGVLKRVPSDKYDRFYFGGIIIFSSNRNEFTFSDLGSAIESRSMIRVGPYLTYDTFKGKNLRLTLGTGVTYNYHKTSIERLGPYGMSEERFFTGFSISPFLSAYAQIENLFPAFDIVAGSDVNFYLGRTLTSSATVDVPSLWTGDVIKEEMKPQANLYLGVQFKY